MTTKKQAVRPSRTKTVGSQPGQKAHKARHGAPKAAKKRTARPKPAKGERPLRGSTKAEAMLAHITETPTALADLASQFGILPHSARAVLSVTSRQHGVAVKTVDGLLTVID